MQILGAEKALFRALKTKGNTPKYGLIYHSTFIGRADAKNKGRISRYLANKCSIATRIDSFADEPSSAYGQKLRDQVEERLKFYETGAAPRKNIDVMEEVARHLKAGNDAEEEESGAKKKKKKDKKKDKKRKADESGSDDGEKVSTRAEEKKEELLWRDQTNNNVHLLLQSAKKSKKDKDFETPMKTEAEEEKKVSFNCSRIRTSFSSTRQAQHMIYLTLVVKEIV